MQFKQPRNSWTWEHLRSVVTELDLPADSYAVGPVGILLADGTLETSPGPNLLVTESLRADLAARGWQASGAGVMHPHHPDLIASTTDLFGSFSVAPDEVIARAEPVDSVPVPPRELLTDNAVAMYGGWAARGHGSGAAATGVSGSPRRRWPFVVLGCVLFLLIGMLLAMRWVGGIDHLTGRTTKIETRVLHAADGDTRCGRSGDPWVVTYGWTAGDEQLTADREICRDNAPPAGEKASFWFDDDNRLVSTLSPTVAWGVAAGTDLFAFGVVGGGILHFRRRARKKRELQLRLAGGAGAAR